MKRNKENKRSHERERERTHMKRTRNARRSEGPHIREDENDAREGAREGER